MKTLKHVLLLASLAIVPALSSASGQVVVKVSGTDQDFIKQTSLKQVFQVIAGKQAPTRSNSLIIRRLASRLVRDNALDYGQLSALGLRVDVAVSSSTDIDEGSTYKELLTLVGNKFDKLYVQTAVQQLKEALQINYKDEISNGSNPQTKAYALRTYQRVFTDYQLAVLAARQAGIPLD